MARQSFSQLLSITAIWGTQLLFSLSAHAEPFAAMPCLQNENPPLSAPNQQIVNQLSDDLNEYFSPYHAISHSRHEITVLPGALSLQEKHLQMIEAAKNNVSIEMSDFALDGDNEALLQALLKRARSMTHVEYVDRSGKTRIGLINPENQRPFVIRVLIDGQSDAGKGNSGLTPVIATALEKEGLQFRYFNLFPDFSQQKAHDLRNLFIVDRETCVSNLCVAGPVTRAAQKNFFEFWALKDGNFPGLSFLPTAQAPIRPAASSDRDLPVIDDTRKLAEAAARDSAKAQQLLSDVGATPAQGSRKAGADELAHADHYTSQEVILLSDKPGAQERDHLLPRLLESEKNEVDGALCSRKADELSKTTSESRLLLCAQPDSATKVAP